VKIVVRGTNWIGDAVMQIPALREIRRVFPDSHITLHTRDWTKAIFQDAEFINEILTFQAQDSVFQQAKIWRKSNFDLAILFTNSFESAILARFSGTKSRFGYKNEARSFLLSNSFSKPVWKNNRHEIYYYLNLVSEVEKKYFKTCSTPSDVSKIDLPVSETRRKEARNILEKHGVDLSKKIIALGVGSTNSRAKRWESESYAKLNDFLQSELKSNVLLVGTKDELDISHEVAEKSAQKPIILTGKTSLSEAIAILAEIDLLVANDMGLAHIAPAVGTKTLTIFGPTRFETTQPIGSQIIRKEVDCSPCMLRDCPIDHRCMTRISAIEVFEKVKFMLKN
jgi:heptosyltransferase II